MRCSCCNNLLNDYEATRRSLTNGEFLDICNSCYSDMEEDVPSYAREDLNPFDSSDEDYGWNNPSDSDAYDEVWDERG